MPSYMNRMRVLPCGRQFVEVLFSRAPAEREFSCMCPLNLMGNEMKDQKKYTWRLLFFHKKKEHSRTDTATALQWRENQSFNHGNDLSWLKLCVLTWKNRESQTSRSHGRGSARSACTFLGVVAFRLILHGQLTPLLYTLKKTWAGCSSRYFSRL